MDHIGEDEVAAFLQGGLFDENWYLEQYPDVRLLGMDAAKHYLWIGAKLGRRLSDKMPEAVAPIAVSPDRLGQLAAAPPEPAPPAPVNLVSSIVPSPDDSDSALRWLTMVQEALADSPWWWSILPLGARRPRELNRLEQCGLFNAREYLDANPDVALAGVDPLWHFVRHGVYEGRTIRLRMPYSPGDGALNQEQASAGGLIEGRKGFRADRPTLFVANHDASRTGAPLVGLNLAKGFDKYNIFTFVGRDGELTPEFLDHSVGVVLGWRPEEELQSLMERLRLDFGLRALIINSVESAPWARIANAIGVPVVSLIHEFTEYTFPVSKSTDVVRWSDRVIVPAHLVEESLQREVQSICSARAPNIVIRHQGALPYLPKQAGTPAALTAQDIRDLVAGLGLNQRHIVLGAGHAQPRKGVDLFVQTAGYVARQRNDVAFLWVGGGYHPKSDLQYSVWVDQTIERMGLRRTVLFLPSQPHLDACFEVSDLFYLPSRLDPYPNVVIDALMAARDVVCFEGATGCAELFREEIGFRGAAVPYADVQAAGEAIMYLIDESPKNDFNARKAAEYFDFDSYLAAVEREVEKACANAALNEEQAKRIIKKGLVERDHYAPQSRNSAVAVRDYVASSRKGLARRNPLPGFSENLWRTLNGRSEDICPLMAELDAGNKHPKTHSVVMLGKARPQLSESLRVALHLHLHFSELAGEFARRLSLSKVPVDIFATVTSAKGAQAVESAFSDYGGGTVQTLLVENRGRDIGPFFVHLRKPLSSYDIVGHLHGKRSLDCGEGFGSRWLNFLLDTLIGNDNRVLAQIIHKFEKQADLGLIFPEDANNVGWTENRSIAEELAQRTNPKLQLPDHPFFPLGTMFWARHEALRPLWNANLTHNEMPLEPLPYDGTILHALERMLPTACQAVGLNWQTVSVPGVQR